MYLLGLSAGNSASVSKDGSSGKIYRGGILRLRGWVWLLCLIGGFGPLLGGQRAASQTAADPVTNGAAKSPAEQMDALQLELTNAWQRVDQIVNQPVKAYVRSPDAVVSVYSPGWFHEGAMRPDFDNVDVRKTQEFIYKNQYVSSDQNPGIMFMGRDLEFNSMTKLFYVDRSLPKHKLTEEQMIEINSLYRIIGRCERELRRLQTPMEAEPAAGDNVESNAAPAAGLVGRIQTIPREKRLRYGGAVIGALIILGIGLRIRRKNAE